MKYGNTLQYDFNVDINATKKAQKKLLFYSISNLVVC